MDQPLHGYGVMQLVEEMSGGRLKLAAGTLYGAISSLLEKTWIKAVESPEPDRKKEYQLTPLGKAVLKAEITRLDELLRNGKAKLEGWTHEENSL